MNPSIKTYQTICEVLGVKPAKITETFTEVPDASLVIVPDQAFDYKQLVKLAQKFGEGQPYSTYVYEELYKLYSPEELSGVSIGKAYRSLYIPHKYNVKSAAIAEQKASNPGHVPTVLEAIAYWFVLRESNETLDFDKTYIRHFDLAPKRLGEWSYVPSSCVGDVGEPYLVRSDSDVGGEARLAVGSNLISAPSPEPLGLEVTEIRFNGRLYRLDEGDVK